MTRTQLHPSAEAVNFGAERTLAMATLRPEGSIYGVRRLIVEVAARVKETDGNG